MELKQEVKEERKRGNIFISVIGKGGSGKTTISRAFSVFLSKSKRFKVNLIDLDYSNKHLRGFDVKDKGLNLICCYDPKTLLIRWKELIKDPKDREISIFDFPASFNGLIYREVLLQSDFIFLVLNPLRSVIDANIEWLNFIKQNGLEQRTVFVVNKFDSNLTTKDEKDGLVIIEKIEQELNPRHIIVVPKTEKIKRAETLFSNNKLMLAFHDLEVMINESYLNNGPVEKHELYLIENKRPRFVQYILGSAIAAFLSFSLLFPVKFPNMEVSKEQHEAHVIEYISKQIESQKEEYDKEQYISLMDKLLPPYKKQLFEKFIKGEGFKYKIMANDNLEHFSQWAFQRFSGFISLDSYESYTSYYAFREEIKKANKGRDLFYKDGVIEVPPYKYERNPKYEQYLCLLAFLERYIDRARITSVFGEKRTKTEHLGIDIASRDGGTIRAIKEGIVYNAGYSIDYGFFVDVLVKEKGDKYVMRYAHLAKRPELKKGRRVKERDVIGYMGKTGKAYGTHLHLEFLVFSDNGQLVPVDALQKIFEIIEQKKALLDESNVALNQADKRKE